MSLGSDIVALIDERIAATLKLSTAVGSVVRRTGATTALVTFDGSSQATPVKCFADVNIDEGDRVGMVRLGVDWTITGTFTRRRSITMPDGATTGQQRTVFGADTPPELAAFGVVVAILFYVTDPTSGLEVGYFFIGQSNHSDLPPPGFRVLGYGNVTYPTPGDPLSATVAQVKCNFQQMAWAQTAQTIFKDHTVRLFPGVGLAIDSGDITHNSRSQPRGLMRYVDSISATAAIGAETVTLTLPPQDYTQGRVYEARMWGSYNGSVANSAALVRVHRTNIAGAVLAQGQISPLKTSDFMTQLAAGKFACTTVGGVAGATFVATLQATTGTCLNFAAGALVRTLEMWDVGDVSQFSANLPVI